MGATNTVKMGQRTHRQPGSGDGLQEFTKQFPSFRSSYKRGLMTRETLERADRLSELLNRCYLKIKGKHEIDYLTALAMIAETYDNFGANEEAVTLLKLEESLIESFWKWHAVEVQREESQVVKARARLMIVHSELYYYRRNMPEEAEKRSDAVIALLQKLTERHKLTCQGSLAMAYRLRAKCLRQEHRTGLSLEAFGQALSCYYDRLKRLMDNIGKRNGALELSDNTPRARAARKSGLLPSELVGSSDEDVHDEACLAIRRIAIVLSQIALVNYEIGSLLQAETNVRSAQLLLMMSSDEVSQAFANVLLATIMRLKTRAGDPAVAEAKRLAEQSKRIFVPETDADRASHYQNHRFGMIADFEIGLCSLRLRGQDMVEQAQLFEEAKQCGQRIIAWAKEAGDSRWHCNGLILQSRAFLDQAKFNKYSTPASEEMSKKIAESALSLAKEALHAAETRDDSRVDALISQAESYLFLKDYEQAHHVLDEAFKINNPSKIKGHITAARNPRLEAVIYLFKAKTHLQKKELAPAARYVGFFEKLRPQIEHRPVLELAEEIQRELTEQENTLVLHLNETDGVNFDDLQYKMLEFIIAQARRRSTDGTMVEMSKVLGVKRQTLMKWQKDVEAYRKGGGGSKRRRIRAKSTE